MTSEPADSSTTRHVGHRHQNIAYHVEWNFRREAFRWRGETPIGPNLHPLGTELRKWLLREGPIQVFHADLEGYSDP